jgi:hypothetical protein
MQKQIYDKNLIAEIVKSNFEGDFINSNRSDIAKIYSERVGILYSDTIRRSISKVINSLAGDTDIENFTDTNQYEPNEAVSVLSALKENGKVMSIQEYCEFYDIPFEHVKTFKLVTHTGKGAYYNIASADVRNTESLETFKDQLLEAIKDLPNKPKTIFRLPNLNQDGHLLVVDPADVHIQKLATVFETGDEYNSQIACQRVREGVEGLIQKASGFRIEKVLFVAGNDILHTDNKNKTTTSGTPQDVDSNWYTAFATAKSLYIEVIDRLLEVADVHYVHNPSNHDFIFGTLLADVIQTYYRDCKNITFDCDLRHRKYFQYGKNLIGTTHGDGAKNDILPILMATEEPKMWSESKHRYVYTHHVHHKVSKDYIGVTVEALRSPSGTDGWHSKAGFCGAPKAVEGFIHHPEYGQIARLTHLF